MGFFPKIKKGTIYIPPELLNELEFTAKEGQTNIETVVGAALHYWVQLPKQTRETLYTEFWYRGLGYNETVTKKSMLRRIFNVARNIFQNIGRKFIRS